MKPRGYWTKERCHQEAIKYVNRKEFGLGSISAYNRARKNGWLDEICSHMNSENKPTGYWTKERCHQEALKYVVKKEFRTISSSAYSKAASQGWLNEICFHMNWTKERCHQDAIKYVSKKEFKSESISAYNRARKNGWLDEICSHMINYNKNKPPGYWTKEKCHESALSCNSVNEFKKEFSGAYQKARLKGWVDEICSHMINYNKNKPSGYWTKERCHEEALKYNHRRQFGDGNKSAYSKAQKNGWLDDICSHMTPAAHPGNRFVYVYEFSDKDVYVGLTRKPKRRHIQHVNKKTSPVYKHLLICKDYKLVYVTNEPIEMMEASLLEVSTAMHYKDNGWTLLNNIKQLGQLGKSASSRVWTKEKCMEIALKYEYRIDWKSNHASSYQSASQYGWLKECTKHMKRTRREAGYWTKEECHNEALKYNSRFKFQQGTRGAYTAAFKNGWLDDICSHMEYICLPQNYWTIEICQELTKDCKTRKDFRLKNSKAYFASVRYGFINTLFPKKIKNEN